MKMISAFIVTSILASCNLSSTNQEHSDIKEVVFHFRPSFFMPATFTIDLDNKTIKQYVFQDSYSVKEEIDSNSYRYIYKDTLIVYYQKTFPVSNRDLSNLMNAVNDCQLDSSANHTNYDILDGISFQISKIMTNNDTISLTSNLSRRIEQSKQEYSLLDPFFELSLNSIDDNNGILIIQEIQKYFEYDEQEE